MFIYKGHWTLLENLKCIGPQIESKAHCSFIKKLANPGLFLFIFVLFSLQFQYKLKKA